MYRSSLLDLLQVYGVGPGCENKRELPVDGPGAIQLSGHYILTVPLHHAVSCGLAGEYGDHEKDGEVEGACVHRGVRYVFLATRYLCMYCF